MSFNQLHHSLWPWVWRVQGESLPPPPSAPAPALRAMDHLGWEGTGSPPCTCIYAHMHDNKAYILSFSRDKIDSYSTCKSDRELLFGSQGTWLVYTLHVHVIESTCASVSTGHPLCVLTAARTTNTLAKWLPNPQLQIMAITSVSWQY